MVLCLCTSIAQWRSTICDPRILAIVTCLAAVSLAGCSQQFTSGGLAAEAVGSIARQEQQSNLQIAQASFQRRAYGLAEKHFRLAVEEDRRNAEAWLGLAASYDQLKRFDLADRAYDELRALIGETVVVLNNLGYSQTLRGNFAKARSLLARAQSLAPDDERVQDNIDFLNRERVAARR